MPKIFSLLSSLLLVGLASAQETPRTRFIQVDEYVGEVIRENEDAFELLDLGSFRKRTETKTLTRPAVGGKPAQVVPRQFKEVTEDEAITLVGAESFIASRIAARFSLSAAHGKIASISGSNVFITVGTEAGITSGQELSVLRRKKEIKDPDTGEVIGNEEQQIARLRVTDSRDKYCKAMILGDLDIELAVGDQVLPDVKRSTFVVLPLVELDGGNSRAGRVFAERLATALVQRDVSVAERTLLDTVLAQIKLSGKSEFDPEAARKFGKQIGATFVIAGTIDDKVPFERKSKKLSDSYQLKRMQFHARVIKVETGDLLFAVSGKTEEEFVFYHRRP